MRYQLLSHLQRYSAPDTEPAEQIRSVGFICTNLLDVVCRHVLQLEDWRKLLPSSPGDCTA